MEPVSVPDRTARKGRKGSLENPEVAYENVPGHVIPILEREFDDFDTEAKKFLDGDTPEDEFIGFRLKQGVYGQRQPDVQMVRVKLPFGGVTPEQLDAFADAAEQWAPLKKGHITTRQNFQFHHVPLADAAKFIPRIRDGKRGFELRIGGGTSIMPRVAPTLYDFVEADNGEYLRVVEAVFRIFNRQDWLRKNRARARIKVFVDKYGIDELRNQVEAELEGDWVNERDFDPTPKLFEHDEEANAPAPAVNPGSPNGDNREFDR